MDEVLGSAKLIRDSPADELPDLGKDVHGRPVDVPRQAFFACALLGMRLNADSKDNDDPLDAIERLQQHTGDLTLPERFDPLYGRERRITMRKGSHSRMLEELQELLLLHTIGDWSHWAVLEKVEVVVPSKLERSLRICDIPGFGDDKLDPFRQSIVDDALRLECSTLCLCLRVRRLSGEAIETTARLDKLGVFEDLFGEGVLRRFHKLATVTALDWATLKPIEKAKAQVKRRCKRLRKRLLAHAHPRTHFPAFSYPIASYPTPPHPTPIPPHLAGQEKERGSKPRDPTPDL